MPSTYAHYKFGEQLRRQLSGHAAGVVEEHLPLYYIGLHGPDLLFYYKPLVNNPVSTLGFGMHNQPASDFFGNAAHIIRDISATPYENTAAIAWLLGFICHFALDSTCHGYIENKSRTCNVTHTEIEVEFDRYLMLKDGLDPVRHPLAGHIEATRDNARIIQPFLTPLTTEQIYKAMKSIIFYQKLLRVPHAWKRLFMDTLLRLSGNYTKMHGLMLRPQGIPECQDSSLRLEKLMNRAAGRCLSLIDNYMEHIYKFRPLDKYFYNTFGPEMNWQSIPVFSYQEELQYEI